MSDLPKHLRQAAAARTTAAEEKARKALRRLAASREPVSFTAVAKAAGVSTDFLYRHPELRAQIERQRAKFRSSVNPAVTEDEPAASSAPVRVLARKLEEERVARRHEVAELRRALEVAQGENLELRRRLERYEPA